MEISHEPGSTEEGYYAVPYEAVTLNGMYLPQLLASARRDAWAAIGPDRRALQGESGRTYRYGSLEECARDVATLREMLREPNSN
jgi:hypothetical protein